LTSQI